MTKTTNNAQAETLSTARHASNDDRMHDAVIDHDPMWEMWEAVERLRAMWRN